MIRLTRDAIAVAVQMRGIARLPSTQRSFSGGTHVGAIAVINRLFCKAHRCLFLLRLDRKIIDGDKGKDCQRGNGFEGRVACHLKRMAGGG